MSEEKRKGRPPSVKPNMVRVATYVEAEEYEVICTLAAREGRTVSNYVCRVIHAALKQEST